MRQKHNLNTPPDLVADLIADLIDLYHLAQRLETGGKRSIAAQRGLSKESRKMDAG
jgi:hypothetical protein